MRFERRGDGRTRLADLHQTAPCRCLLPASEDWPTAVFAATCGGLTGGDAVRFDFSVGAGAAARATTQAAERLYRARVGDAPARIESRVVLGEGASAEWLPQETIVFDGARLQRRTVFELADGADLLACELRVLGRAAHGEVFEEGFLSDRIEVWREGALLWVDALRLGHPSHNSPEARSVVRGPATPNATLGPGSSLRNVREVNKGARDKNSTASPEAQSAVWGLPEPGSDGDPGSPRRAVRESSDIQRALASPAGFGGHPAIATVFHSAPDAQDRLSEAREILASAPGTTVRSAATTLDGLLLARFLAPDAFTLRRNVAHFVTGFRTALGRAPVMPRFWSL